MFWFKSELMVFGLLSLLMGHWIVFVAKICVKSSALSSRFYPCAPPNHLKKQAFENHMDVLRAEHLNSSITRLLLEDLNHEFCPKVLFAYELNKYVFMSIIMYLGIVCPVL